MTDIMQGHGDTHYITFGDEKGMYRLLGTPDKEQPNKYDFELRVEDDINHLFTKFSLMDEDGRAGLRNMFVTALEHTQVEMHFGREDYISKSDFPEMASDELDHLQYHLSGMAMQMDAEIMDEGFSEGIESISGPEESISQ